MSETNKAGRAKPYHHGNLRETLIAEALKLAAESGIDGVSVREVTRRAKVSPGALFRHFTDRKALMTAVAEEAIEHFHRGVMGAIAAHPETDPVARTRAVGRAFLAWAVTYPTHFEIVSARKAINFGQSEKLVGLNTEIQEAINRVLEHARSLGLLRMKGEILQVQLTARAQVYGLARMFIDGHFPSWEVKPEEAENEMERLLDLFIDVLFERPAGMP
ncbi:MAG: TetR family transcriptional regulator [Rhizobium sp.]|nr:TetR family transcriptional regulator [Rhizobium sp.]